MIENEREISKKKVFKIIQPIKISTENLEKFSINRKKSEKKSENCKISKKLQCKNMKYLFDDTAEGSYVRNNINEHINHRNFKYKKDFQKMKKETSMYSYVKTIKLKKDKKEDFFNIKFLKRSFSII